MNVLVAGGGGFIGGHLVARLLKEGHAVRAVDIKPLAKWWQVHDGAENRGMWDLRQFRTCGEAMVIDPQEVYQLAADMGGVGYITQFHAHIARNNTLININMLQAARYGGVKKYLYSSSACVYPQAAQSVADVTPLREADAWPADPEPGYGLEKLYAEKMCQYYHEDHGLDVRVVRFHNVYGPHGDWTGGKEKAPAATCRKMAEAQDGGEVLVWGDGQQTRSFMHINDCVEGLIRLMASDHTEPINLGTEEMVTITELHGMVARIAGKTVSLKYDTTKPQGVRGRNSDNSKLREVLEWEPTKRLEDGLATLYPWVEAQVKAAAE